jgi:glutamyl-tRNA synthetase
VLLQRLLGLPEPSYAHVPLVLGPDGQRLAKRHGAVTLADRAAAGEPVGVTVGRLAASVGLARPGERLTAPDVLARFDPDLLPDAPSVFDPVAWA